VSSLGGAFEAPLRISSTDFSLFLVPALGAVAVASGYDTAVLDF
tara:strand:- start:210 stop:341 length:132 start_codon:yes stop_codon:yes gene_type:complete